MFVLLNHRLESVGLTRFSKLWRHGHCSVNKLIIVDFGRKEEYLLKKELIDKFEWKILHTTLIMNYQLFLD